jgi:hypothetical protein
MSMLLAWRWWAPHRWLLTSCCPLKAARGATSCPGREVADETPPSEIYSALVVEEEGKASSLRGLAEVIGRHGLFSSLYSDRGSHCFVTPKGGQAARR